MNTAEKEAPPAGWQGGNIIPPEYNTRPKGAQGFNGSWPALGEPVPDGYDPGVFGDTSQESPPAALPPPSETRPPAHNPPVPPANGSHGGGNGAHGGPGGNGGGGAQTAMKLPLLSPSQILTFEVPQNTALLENGLWRLGRIALLVGPPGVGKSRLALWLAICQITQRHFCGIKTEAPPRRWLILNTEADIERLKDDLWRMMTGLTDEDQGAVEANLRLFNSDNYTGNTLIEDIETQVRLKNTLLDYQPEVVVFDPWNAFNLDEDKGTETSAAIANISAVAKECGNPAILIVAHSRVGAANLLMASGWNRGAFLKGSKILYANARLVMNLAPADEHDPRRLVLACGKSNNAKPFDPRGVLLNEEDFSFSVDNDFDLESWRDDIEGKRTGKELVIKDVVEVVKLGKRTRKEIVAYIKETYGVSPSTTDRRLREAIGKGYLEKASGHLILGPKRI